MIATDYSNRGMFHTEHFDKGALTKEVGGAIPLSVVHSVYYLVVT